MKSKPEKIWIYDRIHKKRRQVTLRIPTSDRDRKKTSSAIFANFIHQKDAFVAISTIHDMKIKGAPLYTVHDNFITNAAYATEAGKCYINAFFVKGFEPLKMINYFIMLNLKIDNGVLNQYDITRYPMHLKHLEINLRNSIPINLNKKGLLIWEEKIKAIMVAYHKYIETICDFEMTDESSFSDDSAKRWSDFQDDLLLWKELPYNYCLHL